MNTINNEGLSNIYASEPSVYYAEYPSEDQQSRYAFQGAIAALFVGLLILTSLAVS
ncbi:ssl1498 family light-harvesting-like protein [Leptolyngbya sp. 'hensonii']|uniref:photosystem II assembly protein Psb34 n=1 Tax=Leptolyngbya sp. 'hensonii' TaxID=1922337 RepID=UPI000ACCCA1C|nr:ssl1498 family light-harvesting-like protein [Leptolyngbya sp. 'hensonii']